MKKFFIVINIFVLFLVSCNMFNVDVAAFFDKNNPLYQDLSSKTYTVSFDTNGGTGTMPSQSFVHGIAKKLHTNTFIAPSDKSFGGWNTSADGTGTHFSNTQHYTATADTILYAEWVGQVENVRADLTDGDTILTITPDPSGTTLKAAIFAAVNDTNRSSITKIVIDEPAGGAKILPETDLSRLFSDGDGNFNFKHYTSLVSIEGLNHLDTSSVTTMLSMFSGCSALMSLDLSNFNTSSVTTMSGMFSTCSALMSLDLSSFNTSSVTNMSSMFSGCSALMSLDLSSFNTSSVTTMLSMFSGCSALMSLDLSNFNTSSVTTMRSMFGACSALTSLNLSSLDTSNVTEMQQMFDGCSTLTSLDLSNFNTSSVTNMSSMFSGCSALMSLNLSSLDTSNVTDMRQMFDGCSALRSLDVSNFDTSLVNNMYSMFEGCGTLTSLNLSSFDTSNVTYMYSMFEGCGTLASINLSSFDTSLVTLMFSMFEGCGALTSLDLSNFDTSSVTSSTNMFTSVFLDSVTVGDTLKQEISSQIKPKSGTVGSIDYVNPGLWVPESSPSDAGTAQLPLNGANALAGTYTAKRESATPPASAYLTIEYYNGDNLASTADLETMIDVPVLDPMGDPTGTFVKKTIKDHQKEERFLNYGTWNEHKLEFTQAQFEALLIAAVAPVGTTVESFVDMMVEANSSILMEKVNTNTLRYNLAAQYLEVANTPPFEGEVAFWLGNTPADMSVEVDMNNDGTSDGQLSTFATYTGARLVDNILTGSFQTKPELEAFIAKYTGYHGGLSGSVIFIDVTGYVFATPPTSDPSDFDVDATGVITAYNGIDTDVVIPPMDKDGNAITGIGNNAFKDNTTLTSVEIPDGVATIGDSAFSGCYNIVTLEIPDSVNTIGDSAFQNCSDLTTIEIPDSVTSIGDNTFDFCISLESVSIGDNVASIGASAFSGCSSLETIEIPDSVTSIGEFAFANCTNLETITLSNTLNSIGNYAFNFCNKLKNMTIPDSVTSIGEQAFYSTGLVSVIIPASVTSIGNSAFANTSSLISVVVEDANANYKSVANVVYSKDGTTLVGYWIQGTSFTTPAGVTTIKEYAFAFNSTLVSVTIEDGVTNIESYAFAYNSALTTITIPESVTTILSAFSDCDNLATVNTNYTKNADNRTQGGINQFPTTWFPSMNTDLFDADWVFIPTDLAKFTVVSGEITGYSGTDTVIVIPSVDADSNPITIIGDNVFDSNTTIEKVIILDGIQTIDSQAFSRCPNLTAIQIPDSVTTIFGMTFYGSDALTTVYTNEDKLAPPLSWSNTNNGLLFTVPWEPIP